MTTKILIFDLDGTLFDGGHRVHLIPEDKTRTENWHAFNKECANDAIVPQMRAIFKGLEAQMHDGNADFQDIVFVTSRTETCFNETYESLYKAGLDGYRLYMRAVDDHSTPVEFKSRMLDELEEAGNEVFMAFDDDPDICQMMKERGIYAVHVAEWWKYGWKVND